MPLGLPEGHYIWKEKKIEITGADCKVYEMGRKGKKDELAWSCSYTRACVAAQRFKGRGRGKGRANSPWARQYSSQPESKANYGHQHLRAQDSHSRFYFQLTPLCIMPRSRTCLLTARFNTFFKTPPLFFVPLPRAAVLQYDQLPAKLMLLENSHSPSTHPRSFSQNSSRE